MKQHPLGSGREPSYDITFHPSAEAEYLDLPEQARTRFGKAIDQLAIDPRTPRPGADIRKLKDVAGGGPYRLRVGDRRACYAVITEERAVLILGFSEREAGYARIMGTADARLRARHARLDR